MIADNEIRIGNLLSGSRGVRSVKGIKEGMVYFLEDSDEDIKYCKEKGIDYNDKAIIYTMSQFCDPIPITYEWLERLDIPICYTYGKEIVDNLYLRSENGVIGLEEYSEGFVKLPHIKFVHQLQNLYFALTGQELTVKEKV